LSQASTFPPRVTPRVAAIISEAVVLWAPPLRFTTAMLRGPSIGRRIRSRRSVSRCSRRFGRGEITPRVTRVTKPGKPRVALTFAGFEVEGCRSLRVGRELSASGAVRAGSGRHCAAGCWTGASGAGHAVGADAADGADAAEGADAADAGEGAEAADGADGADGADRADGAAAADPAEATEGSEAETVAGLPAGAPTVVCGIAAMRRRRPPCGRTVGSSPVAGEPIAACSPVVGEPIAPCSPVVSAACSPVRGRSGS